MLKQGGNKLYRRKGQGTPSDRTVGENALRVRATQRHEFIPDTESALLPQEDCGAQIAIDGKKAMITNGKITCKVMGNGVLQFYNQDGKLLLEEYDGTRDMYEDSDKFASALEIVPRTFNPR